MQTSRKHYALAVAIFLLGWFSGWVWNIVGRQQDINMRHRRAGALSRDLHNKLSAKGAAFTNVAMGYSRSGDLLWAAERMILQGTVPTTNDLHTVMEEVLKYHLPAPTVFWVRVDPNPATGLSASGQPGGSNNWRVPLQSETSP